MGVPTGVKVSRSEKLEIQRRLLVDEIAADIVNGVAKSDILTKLREGIYRYATRPLKYVQSYEWYNKALAKFKIDNEDSLEEKRQIMYSRYENIYREAVEQGNGIVAKNTLDSMMKFFGLETPAPQRQDVTIKNINLDFGFDDGEGDD